MAFSRRFFLRFGSLTGVGIALRTVVGERRSYAQGPGAVFTPTPMPTATCTPLATAPGANAYPLDWVKYAGLSTFDALCPYLGDLPKDDQNDSSHWGNDDPNKVLTKRLLEHVLKKLTAVKSDPLDDNYKEAATILGRMVRLLQRVRVRDQQPPTLQSCASLTDGESKVLCHMQNIDTLVRDIYARLLQEVPTPTPTATPSPCSTTGTPDGVIQCLSKDVVAITQAIAGALPGHFELAIYASKS